MRACRDFACSCYSKSACRSSRSPAAAAMTRPQAARAEATVMPTGTAPVAMSATSNHSRGPAGAARSCRRPMPTVTPSRLRSCALQPTPTLSLDPATGAYELQPDANYFGADAFEFEVSDGHGNAARAQVEVTVAPVRDPPVIDARAMASVIAAGRDAQLHIAVSDPDGDAVTLSVSQVGGTSVAAESAGRRARTCDSLPGRRRRDDRGTVVRSDRPDRPFARARARSSR